MSNPLSTPVHNQAKAIIGGLVAGLTALGTALTDNVVTHNEGVGIAVAAVVAYGAVFGVKNCNH